MVQAPTAGVREVQKRASLRTARWRGGWQLVKPFRCGRRFIFRGRRKNERGRTGDHADTAETDHKKNVGLCVRVCPLVLCVCVLMPTTAGDSVHTRLPGAPVSCLRLCRAPIFRHGTGYAPHGSSTFCAEYVEGDPTRLIFMTGAPRQARASTFFWSVLGVWVSLEKSIVRSVFCASTKKQDCERDIHRGDHRRRTAACRHLYLITEKKLGAKLG